MCIFAGSRSHFYISFSMQNLTYSHFTHSTQHTQTVSVKCNVQCATQTHGMYSSSVSRNIWSSLRPGYWHLICVVNQIQTMFRVFSAPPRTASSRKHTKTKTIDCFCSVIPKPGNSESFHVVLGNKQKIKCILFIISWGYAYILCWFTSAMR